MDAALENLILKSTEGARKTAVFRISQVKGRSKEKIVILSFTEQFIVTAPFCVILGLFITGEKIFRRQIMAQLEAMLYPIVVNINNYLSSYILVVLLVAVGLWYTIKTRFVQIRYFGAGLKKVFGDLSLKGGKRDQGMSSFQALATAIAAQVGTGNIIGASGAILTGGPGAIFWMWVIAFLGMATIYAEATLAQKTRVVKDGEIYGGPPLSKDKCSTRLQRGCSMRQKTYAPTGNSPHQTRRSLSDLHVRDSGWR